MPVKKNPPQKKSRTSPFGVRGSFLALTVLAVDRVATVVLGCTRSPVPFHRHFTRSRNRHFTTAGQWEARSMASKGPACDVVFLLFFAFLKRIYPRGSTGPPQACIRHDHTYAAAGRRLNRRRRGRAAAANPKIRHRFTRMAQTSRSRPRTCTTPTTHVFHIIKPPEGVGCYVRFRN